MGLGELGFEILAKKRNVVMPLCCLAALFSFIFLIVGISGKSSSKKGIKAAPWTTASIAVLDFDFELTFGLSAFVIDNEDPVKYSSDECSLYTDLCKKAEHAGEIIEILLAISIVCTFCAVVASCVRTCSDGGAEKGLSVLGAMISGILSVVAIAVWDSLVADIEGSFVGIKSGVGYDLALGAGVVMLVLIIIFIAVPTTNGRNQAVSSY